MKHTIRKKLILITSLIVIFQLVTGIVFLQLYKSAMDRSAAVLTDALQKREAVEDLWFAIDRVIMPASDWIITINPKHKGAFPLLCEDVEKCIDKLESIELTEEESDVINIVKDQYIWIKELTKEIFNIPNPQGDLGAARLMKTIDYELRDLLINELRELNKLQDEKVNSAQAHANLAYKRFNITIFGWIASIIIGGIFFIAFSSKHFIRPIHKVQKGTEEVAKGDLDYRVAVRTGDEIEHLASAFNRMSEQLKQSFTLSDKKEKGKNKAVGDK